MRLPGLDKTPFLCYIKLFVKQMNECIYTSKTNTKSHKGDLEKEKILALPERYGLSLELSAAAIFLSPHIYFPRPSDGRWNTAQYKIKLKGEGLRSGTKDTNSSPVIQPRSSLAGT